MPLLLIVCGGMPSQLLKKAPFLDYLTDQSILFASSIETWLCSDDIVSAVIFCENGFQLGQVLTLSGWSSGLTLFFKYCRLVPTVLKQYFCLCLQQLLVVLSNLSFLNFLLHCLIVIIYHGSSSNDQFLCDLCHW